MITIEEFDENSPRFQSLLRRGAEAEPHVVSKVMAIVHAVRDRGDAALFEYMKEFDGVDYSAQSPRVLPAELDAALKQVDATFVDAVQRARRNLEAYHRKQLPSDYQLTLGEGEELARRYSAIDCVGVYVPSGTAPLCSSLYMNVVPALVAGVRRIVVVTAPFKGQINSHILAVARLLGVDEVYGISGAQGVAALAYGTQSIPKVDKIVGPGNKWVTTAKRFVFGAVGIDSLAGPSEVVVIAPDTADPEMVAIDLLAQAEHGTGDEASVAFVPTLAFAEKVRDALRALCEKYELTNTVRGALDRYGAIFVTPSVEQAVAATNRMAPEHAEWLYPEDHPSLASLRNFGALFVGPHTPEAIGDYYAGSNHVLPTQGTARFSSGLTVYDFIRSSSVVKYSAKALVNASSAVQTLATAENMRAHGLSVTLRAAKLGNQNS